MPATRNTRPRLRFALAPAVFLAAALGLTASAQPPEPKKGPDPKAAAPKDKEPAVVKLPDGTYLWLGSGDGPAERVGLTPAELQKLTDQIEQLKKQVAARKAVAPSGSAVRGRVEKRGDQLVAVLKLTITFRTAAPQTAVALGGRKGFLVAAALDGNKLPVLDTTEDGFAVLAEAAGDHTLTLDLEAPVTSRGAKPELGFEIGLPRAPITTLALDPPAPAVKRVNLTTRTPDPAKPGPAESRRTAGLDVQQLAPRPGHDGYALGPVDSLEVTWDPPAAAAQPADQVQSADVAVVVQLTEASVEATARITLRGPAREWKVVAPATADVTADRAPGAGAEVGPALPPVVTRPADPNKPVWKIDLPTGSPAGEWVVTAVTRQTRPKADDPKHRGPFPVGPFAALDVLRETGSVLVKAAPHTHLAFKHGPDLRKAEVPKGDPAVPEEDVTAAFFRLTTGPTGPNPAPAPLLTVEAWPQPGAVAVRPSYRLTLTEAGWKVRAEVRVTPVRTEVAEVAVDVPADWRGLEASPPELVEGVQQGAGTEGFWAATGLRLAGGLRVPVVVRLAAGHKQPFDLVLTATVPVDPGDAAAVVPLPRFPGAVEKEEAVTAAVPEGFEVRGETRGWGDEYAAWGTPLPAAPGADGKTPRAVAAVAGKSDAGLARVVLAWHPYRPDLAADVRAAVTVGERQLEVVERVVLRSPDGFPRPVRFRAPPGAGVTTRAAPGADRPALTWAGGAEWVLTPADPNAKEVTLLVAFAVNLPPRPADGAEWKVPVGLLWPAAATRVDATVRVWSSAAAGRAIGTSSAGWRELPVEPSPDREWLPPTSRDALPALTLAASGVEVPLALDVREVGDPSAVAVWVERGLVQAWAAGDGATEYRARFLVRRWLAPSAEVRLPGPLAGPNPEFLRDGLKVTATPVGESGGAGRTFRVPLPEPAPGKGTVIEVRYQLPAVVAASGEVTYQPPALASAAFVGPVRWQVTVPAGSVPLLAAGATAEFRWRPRVTGVAPSAAASADGLERWFRTGEEAAADDAADGETLTARQAAAAPLTVYRVPRAGFVIVCSVAAFVLLLAVARLPGWMVGPAVAVVGGAIGVAAVLLPHPAAQAAGAAQPGVAGAAVVFLALAAARANHRRRITRLPGFTRSLPEPSAPAVPLPSTARRSGSSGPAPAAPAGG